MARHLKRTLVWDVSGATMSSARRGLDKHPIKCQPIYAPTAEAAMKQARSDRELTLSVTFGTSDLTFDWSGATVTQLREGWG